MRGIRQTVTAQVVLLIIMTLAGSAVSADETRFQPPFDTVRSVVESEPLVLSEVLSLVATSNPSLRALDWQNEAARGRLKQAGLWPNPELGAEIEEFGWDAPGAKESEITLSLAQEFELFGQRGARKGVAQAEIDATATQTKILAYDLYLDTKRRFYTLVHAQQRLVLSTTSEELARDVVENIKLRITKGAALQSEILLAKLEVQRAQLILEEAQQEVMSAQVDLAALWNAATTEISVDADPEPELTGILGRVSSLETEIDSTRTIIGLDRQSAILRAKKSLAGAEARPSVTLSGGYKRLEANNSNSLIFGVSLPLPFFNRNQGTRESLEAELRSLDYEIDRARLETVSGLRSNSLKLEQLVKRHYDLDSLLLPTVEEAYKTLQSAYKAGRVPYTQLLEAQRSLNELHFEHNNMLLEIHEQIITLEALTGVTLRIDKE